MEFQPIFLNEVGTKAQSKSELYRLLTVEGGLYLPPQDQCNMDFISDLCFRDKKALKASDVIVCSAPHIKGLRTDDMIKFIVDHCNEEIYLPRNYHKYIPNRTWLANLCNSLDQSGFRELIQNSIKDRESYMLEKRSLKIDIDPTIASIFNSSQMVAVNKGRSHKLLRKNILRKQRIAEEEEVKEDRNLLNELDCLRREVESLKIALYEKEEELQDYKSDGDILRNLHQKGVIDDNGNPIGH